MALDWTSSMQADGVVRPAGARRRATTRAGAGIRRQRATSAAGWPGRRHPGRRAADHRRRRCSRSSTRSSAATRRSSRSSRVVVHSCVVIGAAARSSCMPLNYAERVADEPDQPRRLPAVARRRQSFVGATARARSTCSASGGWSASSIGLGVLYKRRTAPIAIGAARSSTCVIALVDRRRRNGVLVRSLDDPEERS